MLDCREVALRRRTKYNEHSLPERIGSKILPPGEAKKLSRATRSIVAEYLDNLGSDLGGTRFLDRIERLAALIALWGARINLTATPQDPGEIGFHIIDSLAPIFVAKHDELLLAALNTGSRVLDLGSGAGFPALVLASASNANFTLVESRRKRASFLVVAAAEMGLENVVIEPQHLTSGLPRSSFDVVTGRAFGAVSTFQSAAASALPRGGVTMLYANPGQELALENAARLGLREFRRVSYAVPRRTGMVERVLALWRRC
jgi:16S rRNA (guanine527-N7)-methyltransferase